MPLVILICEDDAQTALTNGRKRYNIKYGHRRIHAVWADGRDAFDHDSNGAKLI